jgi:hypothetical protein
LRAARRQETGKDPYAPVIEQIQRGKTATGISRYLQAIASIIAGIAALRRFLPVAQQQHNR